MKKSSLMLFLSVAVALPNARADEAACRDFLAFMKRSYYVSMSCEDLIAVPRYKLAHRGAEGRKITLDERTYATEALDHLNGNRILCGRSEEIMKYRDKFGRLRTTDIGTDVFVKEKRVPPELLLPIPPKSLEGVPELATDYGAYLDAALSITLKDAAQVDGMMDARVKFWANGISALTKDPACAETFCREIGSIDVDGKITAECGKKIAKTKADDLFLKLTLTQPKPAAAGTVSTANGAKASQVPPVKTDTTTVGKPRTEGSGN